MDQFIADVMAIKLCRCTMIDHCSVSTLSEVLRQAIENEEKLVNELALPGAKLEIRQVNTVHADNYTIISSSKGQNKSYQIL